MTIANTNLESPIDAMYWTHRGLRAEAAHVQQIAERLEEGSTLEPFRQAFYRWVLALSYHAEAEDQWMTPLLPACVAARECEAAHRRLAARLEDVQRCLTEEIGRTMLIARTQRHLFGAVILARIAQDDHLEEEEAFVLPVIRRQLTDAQQEEVIAHLLLDQAAEDLHWPLHWLADHLSPGERRLLPSLIPHQDSSSINSMALWGAAAPNPR